MRIPAFEVTFLLIVVFLLARRSIRIILAFGRLAVYRLGRFIGLKGPGIVFILYLADKWVKIRLMRKYFEYLEGEFGSPGSKTDRFHRSASVMIPTWNRLRSEPFDYSATLGPIEG